MKKRSEVVQEYIDESKVATHSDHLDLAWKSLEKAHIVSQPSAFLHTKVHWIMLLLAWKTFDWKEVWGQIFRFIVAAPGSLIGNYPRGNTGRSNVSAFQKMDISDDLANLLRQIE